MGSNRVRNKGMFKLDLSILIEQILHPGHGWQLYSHHIHTGCRYMLHVFKTPAQGGLTEANQPLRPPP